MFRTVKQLGIISLAAGLAACSSTGPSAGGSTVSFNTATHAGTPPAASLASLGTTSTPLTVTLGANTLVLTDVQLVARNIELQRQGKDVVCESDVNAEQDCEELNVGPALLDLTLAAGASQSFSVQVAAGTYDKAVPVDMTISIGGQTIAATVWYAEGVGAVKQKVEVMGQTITLELKKFTAGK